MAVDESEIDGGAGDGGAVDGNLVEVTVSELAGAIKRTVESAFGLVRLRGEVSGYRGPHSSGHCYFALKDESARIDAVIWRGTFQKLKVRPEEGMEVIATGRVTTYPGRSAYQIVIERIEPAGIGALMALVEERRRKLAAEGLFDEARKKPLPYLPRVIGVVTSPTGAVIRDILHRLADRFPVHVIVWPVRVQGETCAAEVTAAINGFNAIEPGGRVRRPELLIVARGGGSLEDLWGFNDEAVVRAAAASAIPLIAAVGHETDWTLIDHAADRRAPTPTAAAEFAVPVRAELVTSLAEAGARSARALRRLVEQRRLRLGAASRALPRREALLDTARQRADRASEALGRWREAAIRARRDRIAALAPRITLRPLRQRINVERVRIKGLGQRAEQAARRTAAERRRHLDRTMPRLQKAMGARLRDRASRFAGLAKLADSLGYERVLARGYAVVRDTAGTIVSAAADARAVRAVTIEFADGRVSASVDPDGAPKPEGARAKPRGDGRGGGRGGGQGTLF